MLHLSDLSRLKGFELMPLVGHPPHQFSYVSHTQSSVMRSGRTSALPSACATLKIFLRLGGSPFRMKRSETGWRALAPKLTRKFDRIDRAHLTDCASTKSPYPAKAKNTGFGGPSTPMEMYSIFWLSPVQTRRPRCAFLGSSSKPGASRA